MTEILTESFCERCGTRYTFESAAPRRSRVGRVRMLSRGLRNFVLSDETTLAEAMADARSEEAHAATASQLDAFHKTFNFCMTCRQYTCGSCWNEAEGRCLTCAPHLGHEILQAPFAEAGLQVAARSEGSAAPLSAASAASELDEAPQPADLDAWPDLDLDPSRFATALGESSLDTAQTDAVSTDTAAEAAPWPEADDLSPELGIQAPAPGEPLDSDAAAELAVLAGSDDAPAAAGAAIETVDMDDRLSGGILGLEPGQSLDDVIAAYEAAHEPSEGSEPEVVTMADAVATPELEGDTVAEAELELELAAATVTGDDATPEHEHEHVGVAERVVASEPEAEQAPMAEPGSVAEPEPVAAAADEPAREDVVAQPVWTVPEPQAPEATEPLPVPPAPPQAPIAPASDWLAVAPETPLPDWPQGAPQWRAPQAWAQPPAARPEPPRTLAGRPLLAAEPTGLWAASNREVLAQAPAAAAGPQPCVSCGLSLSANARFCRRCGARQG